MLDREYYMKTWLILQVYTLTLINSHIVKTHYIHEIRENRKQSERQVHDIRKKITSMFGKCLFMLILIAFTINQVNIEKHIIIHISRDTIVRGYPQFYAFQYSLKKEGEWQLDVIEMPNVSGLLTVLGSGSKEFRNNYENFQKGNNSDTSRNAFHCFSYTLSNIKCCSCGGAPQLVGLYRKPNSSGKHFGIIYNGQRYFLGSPIQTAQYQNIEWRNELFELVDGETMVIFEDAERQPIGIKTS